MKLHEIEDHEILATKQDLKELELALKADLANLRADFIKALLESERAQRFWIWGLYVVIILSHFWK